MKSCILTLCFLCALLFTQGCASQQAAKLATALAKDPAAFSVEVVTPWGTAKATRVGNNTNSITISPGNADVNKR